MLNEAEVTAVEGGGTEVGDGGVGEDRFRGGREEGRGKEGETDHV